jgi:drug/metabolite transporter (DMT)-like permease
MKPRDLVELLLLAAIWGASFLFMRVGAPEFGALPMAGVRVGVASLVLLPLLTQRGGLAEVRREWRKLLMLGLLNNALPFALYSYAALSITAGLSSILNATAPLWTALVAWAWLGQRPTLSRVLGLALGFGGVVFLAWPQADFKPGGSGWAVLACLGATLGYGLAANFTKRYLSQVGALSVSTGSMLGAALLLSGPAFALRPAADPSLKAWAGVLMLAVLCTALAYIFYFRMMRRVGPTNTIAVTFLIPLFAVLWGALFLGEGLTLHMLAGCIVILLGTALTLGLLSPAASPRP